MLDAQAAVAIVEAMQALKQHVAPARHVSKNFLHGSQRSGVCLPTLGLRALALALADEINTYRVTSNTHACHLSFQVAVSPVTNTPVHGAVYQSNCYAHVIPSHPVNRTLIACFNLRLLQLLAVRENAGCRNARRVR
ncbi:MAG: hypothetical protein ABI178_02465 [Rhodanobacter sp.]